MNKKQFWIIVRQRRENAFYVWREWLKATQNNVDSKEIDRLWKRYQDMRNSNLAYVKYWRPRVTK
jgi:hypothetical protein